MNNETQPLNLNLLPERYQEHRVKWQTLAIVLLSVGLLIGMVPGFLALRREHAMTAAEQQQLETLLAQSQQLQTEQLELETINQQLADTLARIQLLQGEAIFLSQWQTPHAPDIIAAVDARAPGITLNTLSQAGARLTVQGKTNSQAQVLEYARALQATGKFRNVRIEVLENHTPPDALPTVTFTIVMEE